MQSDEDFFSSLSSAAPAYGGVVSDFGNQISSFLGGAASETAGALLRDPEVRDAIEEATGECKTRAKEGVNEWMAENWHIIALGGGILLAGHWMLTTLALSLAFPRSAFKQQS